MTASVETCDVPLPVYLLCRHQTYGAWIQHPSSPPQKKKLTTTEANKHVHLSNSEVLEVPGALLRRLYEIEEMAARRPLPTATSSSKTAVLTTGRKSSAQKLGRDRIDEKGLLERDEAVNFLKAFAMSEDGDSFPTRLAWELQSEFWPQEDAQVMFPFGLLTSKSWMCSPTVNAVVLEIFGRATLSERVAA